LLKDSRVKLNEPDMYGCSPLLRAAYYDHLDVIKWWIASGREMDLGKPGDVRTDAIGVAKKYGKTEVVTLLEKFKSDATKTRHATRVELGWYDEGAAEMFALVVFVSDGLLQIKDTTRHLPPDSSPLSSSFLWNSKWCCAIALWAPARRLSLERRARWPSRN